MFVLYCLVGRPRFFCSSRGSKKSSAGLYLFLVAFGIGLWRYMAMKDLRELSGAVAATVTFSKGVIGSHGHDTVDSLGI